MKKIVVFLYAYKNKALRDSVDSLLNNHSKTTELSVYVYDKNNLNREDMFKDISYEHIMWDSVESKFTCRSKIFQHEFGDYFLAIDGSKQFVQNWDIQLINLLNQNEVLSGSNSIEFDNNDHKFFVKYNKTAVNQKTLTNWIDNTFIFTHFETFKQFPQLQNLKFMGEEEVLSLYCLTKNINIFAIPNGYIVDIDKSIFEFDYIPFSINHNYNLVIDLFKGKVNSFFEQDVNIENAEKEIGYDFSKLNYHPFIQNDIEYNPDTSMDNLEGERFFGGIKSIY